MANVASARPSAVLKDFRRLATGKRHSGGQAGHRPRNAIARKAGLERIVAERKHLGLQPRAITPAQQMKAKGSAVDRLFVPAHERHEGHSVPIQRSISKPAVGPPDESFLKRASLVAMTHPPGRSATMPTTPRPTTLPRSACPGPPLGGC